MTRAVMPPSPRGRSLVWGSRGERRRYRSSDRPTRAELRKRRISIDWVRIGYAHRRAPRERLWVPDGRVRALAERRVDERCDDGRGGLGLSLIHISEPTRPY